MRSAPDKRARCDECCCILDYEIGSPKWINIDVDLCSKCSAERMVNNLFDDLLKERKK